MIPITANVSNALVNYGMHFGRKPSIGDIPSNYTDPEVFVRDIEEAIKNKDPIFGGKFGDYKNSGSVEGSSAKPIRKKAENVKAQQLELPVEPGQKRDGEEVKKKKKRGRSKKQV